MTRTLIIESGQKPTEEQLKEVEEAKKSPINFDEDCGELSPAMMKAFKSAVVQRNRKKKAQEFGGQHYLPNLNVKWCIFPQIIISYRMENLD